jgi:hypothetical protein
VAAPVHLRRRVAWAVHLRLCPRRRESGFAVSVPPGQTSELFGPVAGEGALWLRDADSGKVFRLDPKKNKLAATLEIGDGCCLAVGEGAVWATIPQTRELLRIDPRRTRSLPASASVSSRSTRRSCSHRAGSPTISRDGDPRAGCRPRSRRDLGSGRDGSQPEGDRTRRKQRARVDTGRLQRRGREAGQALLRQRSDLLSERWSRLSLDTLWGLGGVRQSDCGSVNV